MSMLNAPVPPDVFTKPLEVRFERVEILCEASTLSVLDDHVSPVPSVMRLDGVS